MFNAESFHAARTKLRRWAIGLFWGGLGLAILDLTIKMPLTEKRALLLPAFFVTALGGYLYFRSTRLPLTEVLELAKQHKGQLTLTDIATGLGVDVDTAQRCINKLRSQGLARSAISVEKNLFIFPDCYNLPEAEVLALAQKLPIVTLAVICEGLKIDETLARETLDKLVRSGRLIEQDTSSVATWRDIEKPPPPIAQSPPRPSRTGEESEGSINQ